MNRARPVAAWLIKLLIVFYLHLHSPHFCTVIICCLCSFRLCSFLDILSTDCWSTSHQISHKVASLMDKLRSTVLASRAHGTSLNYRRAFNRWRSFATEVLSIVAVFPVEPIHCALFLQYLLASTKSVLPSTVHSTLSSGCMILLVSVPPLPILQW